MKLARAPGSLSSFRFFGLFGAHWLGKRAPVGEARASDGTGVFQFALGFGGKARPRNRGETFRLNRLAADFADSIAAVANTRERGVDFVGSVLIGADHAQREVAIKLIG